MDETNLNIKLAEAQLRARALGMAIRGSTRSEDDADVLEMLALDCVRNLDELLAPVTVVIVTVGERKIEVIKTVRDHTGLGLKEAKDLVEAVPTAMMRLPISDANRAKNALETVGATVTLLGDRLK
jgi:ribosomal protein L7/L12